MRKAASIITAALLAIAPASALADTITIDLDTATYDDLAAARDQITARMDALLAAQATPAPAEAADGMHYSGEGTAIVSDVQLPYEYNAITYTASIGTSYKLRDDKDDTFSSSLGGQECNVVAGPRTGKLLVEGKDAWTLDIAPLATASALTAAEGTGCYVSPIFPLDSDTIINLHVIDPDGKRELRDALSIDARLYALKGEGKLSSDSLVIGGSTDDSNTYNADLILSPVDGAIGYVLEINMIPEYQWTVTPK